MLYESIVRSVSTLIGQWRLVGRSLDALYYDLRRIDQGLEAGRPDDWPWRDQADGTSLFERQADRVKWDLDAVHDDDDAPDAGSFAARVQAEIAQLEREFATAERASFPVPAGKTLLEVAIEFVMGVFRRSRDVLVTPPLGPNGIRSDFTETYNVVPAGGLVGFRLAPPAPQANPDKLPAADPLLALELCRERMDDLHRFIIRQAQDLAVATSSVGPSLNLQGIRTGIEDLGAYPILTTDGYGGGRGPGGGGGGSAPAGAASLQGLVDGALRAVLGRSPKVKDNKSFMAALNQSFTVEYAQGASVVSYQPRSFSGQTELGGGVTGAQASLYARASVALEKALPLLDGLEPLRREPDEEELEAVRAIVRSHLTEVVAGLKAEGGPTTARMDRLLEQLLGRYDRAANEFTGVGQLDELAEEFGFDDEANVNTLDEESNFSNYLAVVDYTRQIFFGWVEFRQKYFGKDLGTRLVLLSRALSVAAESVVEAEAAMDSVYVGPAERQVASFFDRRYERPVMLGELLAWVTAFATDEAPRLVREGGRRGVAAIQPTAILLESLVSQLIAVLGSDPGLPKALQHPRVRFPLQELRGYLDQVQLLAEDVRKPLRTAAV